MRATTITTSAILLGAGAGAVVAGDLNPPLVGMAERFDPGKCVSIQLPVNWKDVGPDARSFGVIMRWSGFFQAPQPDGPDAQLEVGVMPTWSRVELAYWGDPDRPGKLVEGSVKRGEGWVEETRNEAAKRKQLVFRYVESQGQVFKIAAYGSETIFPHIYGHLDAVFDTFKALQKWPGAAPPSAFAKSSEATCELWTDSKDKHTVKRVVDAHAAAWAEMAKVLPGDRAIADPPLVLVFDKDPDYTQFTSIAADKNSPTSVVDFQRRMFVARAKGAANATFDSSNQTFAAIQFCQYYFGGKSPDWIERGLAKWAVAGIVTKGKPEKPPAEFVRSAKAAAEARQETLDAAFDVRMEHVAAKDSLAMEWWFYAWHCFFRTGAGAKSYGERYQKYLDDLRRTGSPDEAKKAWDGVDFKLMKDEFQTWTAQWKP